MRLEPPRRRRRRTAVTAQVRRDDPHVGEVVAGQRGPPAAVPGEPVEGEHERPVGGPEGMNMQRRRGASFHAASISVGAFCCNVAMPDTTRHAPAVRLTRGGPAPAVARTWPAEVQPPVRRPGRRPRLATLAGSRRSRHRQDGPAHRPCGRADRRRRRPRVGAGPDPFAGRRGRRPRRCHRGTVRPPWRHRHHPRTTGAHRALLRVRGAAPAGGRARQPATAADDRRRAGRRHPRDARGRDRRRGHPVARAAARCAPHGRIRRRTA